MSDSFWLSLQFLVITVELFR